MFGVSGVAADDADADAVVCDDDVHCRRCKSLRDRHRKTMSRCRESKGSQRG